MVNNNYAINERTNDNWSLNESFTYLLAALHAAQHVITLIQLTYSIYRHYIVYYNTSPHCKKKNIIGL